MVSAKRWKILKKSVAEGNTFPATNSLDLFWRGPPYKCAYGNTCEQNPVNFSQCSRHYDGVFAMLFHGSWPTSRGRATRYLAATLAVFTFGVGGNFHAHAGLGTRPIPEPSDPTLAGPYCPVVELSTTMTGDRVVYRPATAVGCNAWPKGPFPLVMMKHGNGFNEHHYDYLGNHLASHGFVVASVTGPSTDIESRAQIIADHVDEMFVDYAAYLDNNVALMGHSRGGEAAARAAEIVRDQGLWDVQAVVSIAPTDRYEPPLNLTQDSSPAFLVFGGSRDGDVAGRLIGSAPAPHGTGFGLFDRAGLHSQFSNPVTGQRKYVTKAMFFLFGANHGQFVDAFGGLPPINVIPAGDQNEFVMAYVHSFLRWRQRGETDYRGFFDGTWVPDTVETNGTLFNQQFRHGELPYNRVIDNFEHVATPGTNTLGGVFEAAHIIGLLDEPWNQDVIWSNIAPVYPCPHETNAAHFLWAYTYPVPYLRWDIPAGWKQDVRSFRVLSFRTAQMYESLFNVPGAAKDFFVRLQDSAGEAATVLVSDYAEIRYPDVVTNVSSENISVPNGDYTKSDMITVRIPLDVFSARNPQLDMEHIEAVILQYSMFGTSQTGQMVLDDLEFAY